MHLFAALLKKENKILFAYPTTQEFMHFLCLKEYNIAQTQYNIFRITNITHYSTEEDHFITKK